MSTAKSQKIAGSKKFFVIIPLHSRFSKLKIQSLFFGFAQKISTQVCSVPAHNRFITTFVLRLAQTQCKIIPNAKSVFNLCIRLPDMDMI